MNIEMDTTLETVRQIIESNFDCGAEEIRKFETVTNNCRRTFESNRLCFGSRIFQ